MKDFQSQFKQEAFENAAVSFSKPPTFAVKEEQVENIRTKLYQKQLIKVIQQ